MVIHTQTIRWLLATNCLSVVDHFVGLALKGLNESIEVFLNLWLSKNLLGMTKNIIIPYPYFYSYHHHPPPFLFHHHHHHPNHHHVLPTT